MKKLKFGLLVIFLFLVALPLISSAHYITGRVNNAGDGTNANDHTIILWNSLYGANNNLTDIIGPNGNSGANNLYLFDCEMLNNGCRIGDNLSIKVINNGDNYLTRTVNITVTGAGYDIAPQLTLNSRPNVTLNFPANFGNISNKEVNFNCSYMDLDSNIANISLYGNWTGEWNLNETKSVTGNGSVIFTKIISEGIYSWNCFAIDDLSISSATNSNFSFTLDSTSPNITSVLLNSTSINENNMVCGISSFVRVNCTVTDNLIGLDRVVIEAIKPLGRENYSTQLLSGNTYYSDIQVNQEGEWIFNCMANDSVGNQANLTSEKLMVRSDSYRDAAIYSQYINFSNYNPIENQEIIINAAIYNLGCIDINNLLVGFYNRDPSINGEQIGNNQTINIRKLSSNTSSINWNAEVGLNNIFVLVDVDNSLNDGNESNNEANKTIDVTSWQEFYGNISIFKTLASSSLYNLSLWFNFSSFGGNIFIADKENNVNWLSLQAIGRNINNESTADDFSDIDNLLGMSNFADSVSRVFSDSGTPKGLSNFTVHQKVIQNVPVINSTVNSNFITGILWDSSDDKGNGEFDISDREDLVFVSKINKFSTGAYGIYDYEIKIPVRLRSYNSSDETEVYLYYDLI